MLHPAVVALTISNLCLIMVGVVLVAGSCFFSLNPTNRYLSATDAVRISLASRTQDLLQRFRKTPTIVKHPLAPPAI